MIMSRTVRKKEKNLVSKRQNLQHHTLKNKFNPTTDFKCSELPAKEEKNRERSYKTFTVVSCLQIFGEMVPVSRLGDTFPIGSEKLPLTRVPKSILKIKILNSWTQSITNDVLISGARFPEYYCV